MKITAVIPARYGSSRFPGKVLAEILGKPMVQWVYERSSRAKLIDEVLVATDDKRVIDAVAKFGGNAVMTSREHRTGTDRIAELAVDLQSEILINVQGDEPTIEPAQIDLVADALIHDSDVDMATLCSKITNEEDLQNPNVVKVVVDTKGCALYFSRFGIPFNRDGHPEAERLRHLGLYSYRREFILKFKDLPPAPLEKAERLEQLRALEYGYKIKVIRTEYEGFGVDTPEDLEQASELLKRS